MGDRGEVSVAGMEVGMRELCRGLLEGQERPVWYKCWVVVLS